MADNENTTHEESATQPIDTSVFEGLTVDDKNQLIEDLRLPVAINLLAEDEAYLREAVKDSSNDFDELNDIQNYEMLLKRLKERHDDGNLDDFMSGITQGKYLNDLETLGESVHNNNLKVITDYFGAKPDDTSFKELLKVNTSPDAPIEDFPDDELKALGKFFAINLAKYGALAAAAPMMGFAAPALGALLIKAAVSKVGFKILAETGVLDAANKKLAQKLQEVSKNNPEGLSKKKALFVALAGGATVLAMVGGGIAVHDILENKNLVTPLLEGAKEGSIEMNLESAQNLSANEASPEGQVSSKAQDAIDNSKTLNETLTEFENLQQQLSAAEMSGNMEAVETLKGEIKHLSEVTGTNIPTDDLPTATHTSPSPISDVVKDMIDNSTMSNETLDEFKTLQEQIAEAELSGNTEVVETLKGDLEYLSEVTGVEIPAIPEPAEPVSPSPISDVVKDMINGTEPSITEDTVGETPTEPTSVASEQTLKIMKDDTLSEVVFDHVFRVNGFSFDSAGDADKVFKAIAEKYHDGDPNLILAGESITLPEYSSPEEMMKDLGLESSGIEVTVGEPRDITTKVEVVSESKPTDSTPSIEESGAPIVSEPEKLSAEEIAAAKAKATAEAFDKVEYTQLEKDMVQAGGPRSEGKVYGATPSVDTMVDNSGVSMTDAQREWFVEHMEAELAEHNSHNAKAVYGTYNAPVLTQELVDNILENYPPENNIEFSAKTTIGNLESSVYYDEDTGNLNATRDDMTISDFANEIVAKYVENGDIKLDSGNIAAEITRVTSELRSANPSADGAIATIQLPQSMHNVNDMNFDNGGMFDESKFEDVFSKLGEESSEYAANVNKFADHVMPLTEGGSAASNAYVAELNELSESKFSKIVYDEDSGELKSTFMGQNMDDFSNVIVQNHIEDGFVDPEKHDIVQYKDFILTELKMANDGVSVDEPVSKLNVGDILHGSQNIGVREADIVADMGFESVNEKIESSKESNRKTSKMKI